MHDEAVVRRLIVQDSGGVIPTVGAALGGTGLVDVGRDRHRLRATSLVRAAHRARCANF